MARNKKTPKQASKKTRHKLGEQVNQELDLIAKQHPEGKLLPKAVVQFAYDHRASALHGLFCWDTQKAAEAYWLETARRIIRARHIIYETPAERIHYWFSLTPDRKETGGGYRSFDSISASEGLTAQLIADAKRDFEIFKRRYDVILQALPSFTAFAEELTQLDTQKVELSPRVPLRKAGPSA